MFIVFNIEERGAVPRRFRVVQNESSRAAWRAVGQMFHDTMRDKRFSKEHGLKAGYAKRRGEEAGASGKAFWKSYTGEKQKKWHHTRPLEWSGTTRRNVRSARYETQATEYGVAGPGKRGGGIRIFYPGAQAFNFRPKGGRIHMRDEFTRLLKEEVDTLTREYERVYVDKWNADRRTTTMRI
jgi:hypothetical protein